MENKKYYTPDIEDIRINYRCEVRYHHSNPFTSYIFSESDFAYGDSESAETDFNCYTKDNMVNIRTKYLDSDDIISLGFKEQEEQVYLKDNIQIIHNIEDNYLTINHCYSEYPKTSRVYSGLCKSKNELKTILSWVK